MKQKIDVRQMARDSGFLSGSHGVTTKRPSGNCTAEIENLVAMVLERAAIECEQSEAYRGSVFAQRIRALKPSQGQANTLEAEDKQ